MENLQDEEWIDLPCNGNSPRYIVALSDRGRLMRLDGSIEAAKRTLRIRRIGSKSERASHLIAENFLVTVRRPDQNIVDHISHHPSEYLVNDVRNLRWCTIKENCNFSEAKDNRRIAMNSQQWKDRQSASHVGNSPWNKDKEYLQIRETNHWKYNPNVDQEDRVKHREYMTKRRAAKREAKRL